MNGEHPIHPMHPSLERLHRLHDGELSEQEASELRLHLRTCAPCQAELDALDRLSDMVRSSSAETAAVTAVDFTQMFAEIERAVAQPSESSQSSNVISLDRKRSGSRVLRAAPALGALALAAAALLMLTRNEALPADAGDEIAMLDASQHAEVTAVKFGRNAGQVFPVPLPDGVSVTVVWIDDDEDEEE